MFEGPGMFEYGPHNEPEKNPRSVREIVSALQEISINSDTYTISDTEKAALGSANAYTLDSMTESDIKNYLEGFLESLQIGRETPETLQSHTMFKAIYTKALDLQ